MMKVIDVAVLAMALLFLSSCATKPMSRPAASVTSAAQSEDADIPSQPKRIMRNPGARADRVITERAEPVWFGLLHAHTFFSDGSGTPTQAYARAKQRGVDFFAITEHNHAEAEAGGGPTVDGVLIASTPELYNADEPVSVTRRPRNEAPQNVTVSSLIAAAGAAQAGNFVALYGQEFSTIGSGNHVNVFDWDEVLTVDKGDYRALYGLLDAHVAQGHAPPLVQMNHPDVSADLFNPNTDAREKQNDYGFDDYGKDFRTLVAETDKYVALIELLSGPAKNQQPKAVYQYGSKHNESDYFYYLSQGFHISPSVGHDNHFVTWGDSAPSRMGVFASSLTKEALVEAMHANRTFASEDTDLVVEFSVNGQPMGDVLVAPAGSELILSISVKDATEPESEYEVWVVHGTVKPQKSTSLKRLPIDEGELGAYEFGPGSGIVELDRFEASGRGEFFYLRVIQLTDGDRAWTAPIWINHRR